MPHERSSSTYLNVSFGALRQKVDATDPKAEVRELKDGTKVYERLYDYIEGVLEDVVYRDHPEYGRSWLLSINEGGEPYVVQIQQNSRYGTDFLKKFPFLRRGRVVKVSPYDYEKNGKHKIGVFVEMDGQRIDSYFQKFTELPGGGWNVENLHGFPSINGGWEKATEKDRKIYFIEVDDFLSTAAVAHLSGAFLDADGPVENPKDDLPF